MHEPLLTYRGTVYPWHCDHVGHMNVMWYVGKFDEATWHLFHALGLSPSYLRGAGRGMAAVDQHLSYLRELRAGDVVTIRTTLLEFKEKSLRFVHEMSNDETGEVAARTTLKAVHMDTSARRSCAFAEPIVLKATAHLQRSNPGAMSQGFVPRPSCRFMAARRAGGQGVGARTGDERPNLLAMRCALPAVVALLLLLPLRSRAADERPAGPNCGLTAPPPEAGEDYKRGATLRIHPRAKDIGAAYTGCQIVWAPAAQGWSVVAIVAIENGQPIRSWSPDGTGHEPCRYEQGRLAAGSATTCPDARALIAKSLAPGCVAKRLQAVQEKGFGAPAPSGCDHE